jgi:glutamate-1-semialdehyde 2,1-aminomutase
MATISNSSTPTTATACEQLLDRGRKSLAGGDSSTMRVLPYHLPLVAERGQGARVWDADGREYLDLNMAYGPLLFGHRPKHVIRAVRRQIEERGSQLGFPTEISMRVAEKLKRLYPGMELIRFSNSGTEAIAAAVRLARVVTGRSKIILFEGHYHGWSDAVFHRYHAPLSELPKEGFGPALPGTLGMAGAPWEAICVRWNDLDSLHRCLDRYGDEVAAVIMEPIMCNSGVIPPEPQYLPGVREATLDRDILLIFDEVITGMRVAGGGAQEYYMVSPDITVVSKALGGGYPVSAFGASRSMMEYIVKGTLFHGGVYAGNAMVMAAAEAVIDKILFHRVRMYQYLHVLGERLAKGLDQIMNRYGVPHVVQYVGPVISLFFTDGKVDKLKEYRDVRRHGDFEKYISFQHELQRSGVYIHPNMFETMFLSTAHKMSDIAAVLDRVEDATRCCLVK